MYKLSVIIPAYNAEKYLNKCIESVLNQTFKNIEIIVVNDGSKDGTKNILDEYSSKCNNIIVIHQENKGVSEARNAALREASGDYIAFLDSDDYIDPTMYEKLLQKAVEGDYDLVACNTNAIYPMTTIIIDSGIADNQEKSQLLIDAYAVLWNKVYKASILKDCYFKADVWYEDVLYLYQVYTKVNKVGRVDEALHYYRQNLESITHTYSDKLYDLIENMDDILEYYKLNKIYDMFAEQLEYSYVRYLYATFIKRLAKSKDYEKFNEGVDFVVEKVKNKFPKYKKNVLIRQFKGKSLYLRYFNKAVARLIYVREKNKMN